MQRTRKTAWAKTFGFSGGLCALALLALSSGGLFTGCHTTEGVKQDAEATEDAVEDAAEEAADAVEDAADELEEAVE